MSTEVQWGIFGPGFIANLFAEDLARTPRAGLVTVASSNPDGAAAFAARQGASRHYDDYPALAEDPDVDIVYVVTPHSHHHQHARLLLEADKPALVEKPFALTAARADDMFGAARSRGIFLMDAPWTLCNPLMRDVVARVRSGEIGTPQAFSATIRPVGGVPRGHRVEDPALGGSFMLECLVYTLGLLLALFSKLSNAHRVSAVTDRGGDVYTTVTLASAAGVATMSGGFTLGTGGAGLSTLHLIGTDGWLQLDDGLFNPGRAMLGAGGSPAVALEDSRNADRYRWEIEEAGRCLVGGQNRQCDRAA